MLMLHGMDCHCHPPSHSRQNGATFKLCFASSYAPSVINFRGNGSVLFIVNWDCMIHVKQWQINIKHQSLVSYVLLLQCSTMVQISFCISMSQSLAIASEYIILVQHRRQVHAGFLSQHEQQFSFPSGRTVKVGHSWSPHPMHAEREIDVY